MTIYAAGALCWREVDGQLLVAIIHRNRYNDWSWPKGKVDPGESLPETAVREIREETGLKVKLGVFLGIQEYGLANGAEKQVHYWAAKVTDKALNNSKFTPDDEVASVDWITAEQVLKTLTYDHDKVYLERLVALHKEGLLDTKPFVVLRHAKATPRNQWPKDEAHRPLVPLGHKQARALVAMLTAYGVKRVITSPWARCVQTVTPYAKTKGLKLVRRGQLTEFGSALGPQRTFKAVRKLVEEGKSTVICSHRPALPTILDALCVDATPRQEILIHEARALAPADLLVVHFAKGEGSKRRIAGLEIQSPNID